ncbi:Ig-like domain-containing protein [Wenyingzhuangia sp. chi5]|uniref:Ig-like domain-containing protein n=1 Tax=Wenyingzhuangia gilva TaxID=3057677 RepID=A0ABT8VQU4_9FLAO|nr:Ig-like domain-containing protein [Wenyingzhuangia sp. chi5]MDO3694332.1 Ig-like domain-containing protein [Wenyingzhuangia sp. chi5]
MKFFRLNYLLLSLFFLACSKDSVGEDIKEVEVLVTTVNITGADITEGTTSQMNAVVIPENATNKSISWSISDTSIAEISSGGLITAKKNGTITVTATALDKGTVKGTKEIVISSFTPEENLIENVTQLKSALSSVKAGETILVKGGTYVMNSKITLSVSGTENNKIELLAKEGTGRVKLDFSSMSENSSNQGIVLNADYWYVKGIDIFKAGDNGLQVRGSNNLIEFCSFSECSDTGLQIDNGGANNTILNCDSFYNADSTNENADGFACKLTAGTGKKFIGCRAWQNLDDGWDGYLRGVDNILTTYENCWAIKNGYNKQGVVGIGDGNGFKTGGSDDKKLKHNAKYTNCIAVGNTADGFDHNSNRGTVTIYNCSAYDNGRNYNFSGSSNPLEKLIIKNCNYLGSYGSTNATTTDITNNSWQNGITTTQEDFVSIDYLQLLNERKVDGSLPDVTFFHLNAGSDLIDAGVDVALPFNGTAPDLGAFEL